MQFLSRAHKTPEAILNLKECETLTPEKLLEAYESAKLQVSEALKLETTTNMERNTSAEVEWAYRELLAQSFPAEAQQEDDAVSAVLLPSLSHEAAHSLGQSSGNVVHLSAVKNLGMESANKELAKNLPNESDPISYSVGLGGELYHSDWAENNERQTKDVLPELRDVYAKLSSAAHDLGHSLSSGQQAFHRMNSHEPMDWKGERSHPAVSNTSSPLSSRAVPPVMQSPKTIKTVIGGQERKVVNTIAPAALTDDVREKYRAILERTETLGGEMLRLLREAARVDKRELCVRTRVSLDHLDALEADDFHLLPAPVYYRGFVVSYLKYLGIPRQDLIDAIVERFRLQRRTRNGPAPK